MNRLMEEHCNVNQDSCAYNIKSKRRVVEEITPPPPNQASTLGVVPHVQIVSYQHNASQFVDTPQQ